MSHPNQAPPDPRSGAETAPAARRKASLEAAVAAVGSTGHVKALAGRVGKAGRLTATDVQAVRHPLADRSSLGQAHAAMRVGPAGKTKHPDGQTS